jgi:hypothetical protein
VKTNIRMTQNTMSKSLKDLEARIASIPAKAFEYFVSQTPLDKGNARRRTVLKNNTIHADYAYAQALDQGSSKQAPKGMSEPTEKYVATITKQMLRK